MRKQTTTTVTLLAVLSLTSLSLTGLAFAEEVTVEVEPALELSRAELVQLAGPIALYPDDLLAIVLPAATYPLQVVAAARFLESKRSTAAQPNPEWDESIVALLNYPEALALLNEDINWTWQLGQAVVDQEKALMVAVQDVRRQAHASGNIDSDDKQTVYVKDDTVIIEPAEEDVIYVPHYEPAEVVVDQPGRVYHYYPRAYPVYYYPYASHHRFYDTGFWGLSSLFSLNWDARHLFHYSHGNNQHRYYGRDYHTRHFYRTDHYRTNRYRTSQHHQRRWSNASRGHRIDGHWRPANRYAGSRPTRRAKRHQQARIDRSSHRTSRRHLERRGRHHYADADQRRADRRRVTNHRKLRNRQQARNPDRVERRAANAANAANAKDERRTQRHSRQQRRNATKDRRSQRRANDSGIVRDRATRPAPQAERRPLARTKPPQRNQRPTRAEQEAPYAIARQRVAQQKRVQRTRPARQTTPRAQSRPRPRPQRAAPAPRAQTDRAPRPKRSQRVPRRVENRSSHRAGHAPGHRNDNRRIGSR